MQTIFYAAILSFPQFRIISLIIAFHFGEYMILVWTYGMLAFITKSNPSEMVMQQIIKGIKWHHC